MNQAIMWENVTESAYQGYEKQVRRLPLLQSVDYGRAAAAFYNHAVRWFVVKNADGRALGLCAVHENNRFGGMVQMVALDRGPVWFAGHGGDADFAGCAAEFARAYPRKWGRTRRFIPEYEHGDAPVCAAGFQRRGPGYETIWLDLTRSADDLRADLRKNWRGSLKKAEKSGLCVEWDMEGRSLPLVLKYYQLDKNRRNYGGPSVSFMREIGGVFAQSGSLLIGRALLDDVHVGSILILCHGRSATYQIGWSAPKGREFCAHHLLLWQALDVLKQRGIEDFDLGGINETSAAGVEKFKTGMGGDLVRLPGLYG